MIISDIGPVDTIRKLKIQKTFRRCPGRLLNVLCTFSLRPVSTGKEGGWGGGEERCGEGLCLAWYKSFKV